MRELGGHSSVTVVAAMAGDQGALDELVRVHLPLVYNIVGRALDGHADVDDVVQETMLQVIRALPELRDPDRFRSWLVAVTMQQVRARWRARMTRPVYGYGDELASVADPGADFVDLTITQLGLQGQRQEVAEATRWLDGEDRHLLSLWWLEAVGELTRPELAEALQLSPQHATVRVQRMRAQLDAARAVVRALWASPRCPELGTLVLRWDGRPAGLWRKRLARHTRECERCNGFWSHLVPADRLLVGMALVPVPVGLALHALAGGTGGTVAAAAAAGGGAHSSGVFGWLAKITGGLAGKPVAAATAVVVTATGGAMAVYQTGVFDPPAPGAHRTPTASASVALPSPSVVPSPSPSKSVIAAPMYGSRVDRADSAPPKANPPGPLPKRPVGPAVTVVAGAYQGPTPGTTGGKYVMVYRDDNVTLKGRGYVEVRYQLMGSGSMVMPTWTGLKGKLFHAASGGTRRMDDAHPGDLQGTHTWMGDPERGYTVLPEGAQQMWQNEFLYLDGQVTLTNNERGADYNLIVMARTWDYVNADINSPRPDDPAASGWVRYGLVRDTGDDGAPVPQYCTRQTPADPAQVPQVSKVR